MATIERDLWPEDLEDVDLVAPVAIMKDQAARLGSHTRGLITADVTSAADPDSESSFLHMFYVRARALRYEHQLFSVTHGIELYPVAVFFEELPQGRVAAENEEAFIEVLATVFRHPATAKLIKSLLAQVEA